MAPSLLDSLRGRKSNLPPHRWGKSAGQERSVPFRTQHRGLLFEAGSAHMGNGVFMNTGESLNSCRCHDTADNAVMAWSCILCDCDYCSIESREREVDLPELTARLQTCDPAGMSYRLKVRNWSNVDLALRGIGRHAGIGFDFVAVKGDAGGERDFIGALALLADRIAPLTVAARRPARLTRNRSSHVALTSQGSTGL